VSARHARRRRPGTAACEAIVAHDDVTNLIGTDRAHSIAAEPNSTAVLVPLARPRIAIDGLDRTSVITMAGIRI
jgi:hypothetical protein